jgi:acetyl esterase/lipase
MPKFFSSNIGLFLYFLVSQCTRLSPPRPHLSFYLLLASLQCTITNRLAPEHTFPAMVDDAITAYKWLIYDQKISAKRIVFAGDSAGGGLVLLTLFALQDEGKGKSQSSLWPHIKLGALL